MREIFRRGLLLLTLIVALGGVAGSNVQAWEPQEQRTILEVYLDSPIPEDAYDLVEEAIATEVTKVLEAEGVSVTPPVDFEIVPHIYTLIVSPREEIALVGSGEVFYEELSPARIEALEYEASTGPAAGGLRWLEPEDGLVKSSTLVTRLGGIATDPPRIVSHTTIWIVQTAAHEWGHHYLFQYPLGWHIGTGVGEMKMLNEMVADIIADEITKDIIQKYDWKVSVEYKSVCDKKELQPIRITVDQLLTEGQIEEAEAYMEEMRLELCSKGWCPRKLNQAFFAFCGQYGEGAEGDSPIPNMLKELRARYPSLKEFLEAMRKVSSYEDFLVLLEEKGIDYPEG